MTNGEMMVPREDKKTNQGLDLGLGLAKNCEGHNKRLFFTCLLIGVTLARAIVLNCRRYYIRQVSNCGVNILSINKLILLF